MRTHSTHQSPGYILVSTIWVLAFLSMAAAAVAEWYGRSLALVAERVEYAQSRVEEQSTRATLLYEIATGDLGGAGIFLGPREAQVDDRGLGADGGFGKIPVRQGVPDIVFDGVPYLGVGSTRFSVQDQSGLWGILPETPPRTRALLMSRGISYEDADVLASLLADYVDSDDLVRINGAESTDYRFRGMEPPSNRPLESVYELKRVMGWAELDALWADKEFLSLLTLDWAGQPNPSVAPQQVLMRMPGANAELVNDLLAQRRGEQSDDDNQELTEWITQLRRADTLTALVRPSHSVRLRFWRDGERQCREYSVKFSAGDQEQAPWIIENNYLRPLTRDLDREPANSSHLPAFVL